MSHKILNKDRERTPVTFSDVSAIAATRFLQDRIDAGLPVPAPEQVKRAQRLIAGNPLLRRFNTPLGIQQLALEVPLSKREKRLNRRGEDDGGLALTLEPRRVRYGDEREVSAPLENVEAFLENNPQLGKQDAALAIAGMAGYDARGLGIVLRRVERFTNGRAARPCGHIRSKAQMLDAIAKSAGIIDAREEEAAKAAASQGAQ